MHIFYILVHKNRENMRNIAIFASGNGTNAENIAEYFSKNEKIKVALIVSNRANAGVHERARRLGIPSLTLPKADFIAGEPVLQVLREYRIDFVVLAGFMCLVSEPLLRAFPNRIVNIHPALLPKFGGKGMFGHHVHEAVVAAGEKESGITIHYINEQYDEGQIVFQASCPLIPEDTPDTVAAKVHALEYRYYPQVIEQIIGKIEEKA